MRSYARVLGLAGITAVCLLVLFLIFRTITAQRDMEQTLLPYQCGQWYLSGVNIPWQDGGYGADFGTVEEWGQHTYSAAATEAMFAELAATGVNSVRWWLFTDGRGAPEFDANSGGNVTGLDADFLPSIANATQLAAQYDIYLVFVLWDFAMIFADSDINNRGEHAGGHRNLIVDAAARQTFIDNALLPLLAYPAGNHTIGTHPNVLAWEVINEPEWLITDLGAVDSRVPQPVSLAEMQRFVAELSAIIHTNSRQMVTVGSAALKWNSDTALGATGNLWQDSALSAYAADGTVDFYQIHYYAWMNGDEINWSYSPLFNSFTDAGLDKPTIIGEFPANSLDMGRPLLDLLHGFYDNGYAGAWTWSYEGVDEHGGWADSETAVSTFNQAHADETAITKQCSEQAYLPLLLR